MHKSLYQKTRVQFKDKCTDHLQEMNVKVLKYMSRTGLGPGTSNKSYTRPDRDTTR